MQNIIFFIDVSTLSAKYYTGIPNVTYNTAKYFFNNYPDNTVFFKDNLVVKKEIIEYVIKTRSGKIFSELNNQDFIYDKTLYDCLKDTKNRTIGIFSYYQGKSSKKFDYTIQFFYDLTPLLIPECHNQDTAQLISRIIEELRAVDLTVCISESSKEDLVSYMNYPEEKTLVSLLGYDKGLLDNKLYRNILDKYSVEKFILILGTIEPRKNVRLVLDFLEKNPEILEQYKFVFIGHDGWGKTFNHLISDLRIDNKLKNENIRHLGYVSDEEKNILLMTAELLIYPSIYEGFGLPVLEAMSVGCPVLTSISSSIPEVGEDVVFYFDPYHSESFTKSFYQAIDKINKDKAGISLRLITQANKYSWDKFLAKILEKIK